MTLNDLEPQNRWF